MATAIIRSFRGNPYCTITSITPNSIAASRTICSGIPAFFHLSAQNVVASGTDLPYEDLESRWRVVSGYEGLHKFSLPWLNQIQDGVLLSNIKDSELDQVGPEAVFRFYQSGIKVVELVSRGSDGNSGYIVASSYINLYVVPQISSYWYDSDNGNNSNDGLDPWGLNLTGVTFNISDNSLTHNSSGFSLYDHNAAILPEDLLAKYNKLYVSGYGLVTIDSKTNDTKVILSTAIATGNVFNLRTSTGPRASSALTDIRSNLIQYFKGGNIASHTVPTNNPLRTKTNCSFLNYGTGLAYHSGSIRYSEGTAGQDSTHHCWAGWNIDGRYATVSEGALFHVSSAGLQTSNVYFSRVNVSNYNANQLFCWQATNGPVGCWDCSFINRSGNNNRQGAYISAVRWVSLIGCHFEGLGHSTILDHHIYPDLTSGNLLCKWINFGWASGRSYCINTNAHGNTTDERTQYILLSECNMTGPSRSWDAGRGSPGTGVFKNFVSEGHLVHDFASDGQIAFAHAETMTIRDLTAYNNSGGRFFNLWNNYRTNLNLKFYHSQIHCDMPNTDSLISLPNDLTVPATFRNLIVHDLRTSGIVMEINFSNVIAANNGIYTPNNTIVIRNCSGAGSNHSFATYQSVLDSGALQINPYWIDPTGGNLSIACPTNVSGSPNRTNLSIAWSNPSGAVLNKIGYDNVSGAPYSNLLQLNATGIYLLGGLQRGTIYFGISSTNIYGQESVYSIEESDYISGLARLLRILKRI